MTIGCGASLAHPALATVLSSAPNYPGHGDSTHGRGGQVLCVENLNDSGTGSLRAALTTPGPRLIVFNIGGLIELQSPIVVTEPNYAVYGQTAPGDGITLTYDIPHTANNGCLRLEASNGLIMHIRSRPRAPDVFTDAVRALSIGNNAARPVQRIAIIHSSLTWASDECLTIWGTGDTNPISHFTIACNLIAEPLNYSYGNADLSDPRGFPAIIGAANDNIPTDVSMYWNVWAHGRVRNPKLGCDRFDSFQNIHYGGTTNSMEVTNTASFPIEGIIEDSEFRDAPYTPSLPGNGQILFRGNTVNLFAQNNNRTLVNGNLSTVVYDDDFDILNFVNSPGFTCPRPELLPPAWDDTVIAMAGALPRDSNDSRIMQDVIDQTGFIVDCVDSLEVTPFNSNCAASVQFDQPSTTIGQPVFDINQIDKIPDQWKVDECGLPSGTDTTKEFDPVGYSYFEHYINQNFGF